MNFHEIYYWRVSLKFVNIFHFWLKSDICNRHCVRISVHFCMYLKHNHLNFWQSEKCFELKFSVKMIHGRLEASTAM